MPTVSMTGVVPIGLEELWRLFELHMHEDTIRSIHSWILRSHAAKEEGSSSYAGMRFPEKRVVDREVRIGGRTRDTRWTYAIRPPTRFSYEIKGTDGSRAHVENTYRETSPGTAVATKATVAFGRAPGFLQAWVVRRLLSRADQEDLAFLGRQ